MPLSDLVYNHRHFDRRKCPVLSKGIVDQDESEEISRHHRSQDFKGIVKRHLRYKLDMNLNLGGSKKFPRFISYQLQTAQISVNQTSSSLLQNKTHTVSRLPPQSI